MIQHRNQHLNPGMASQAGWSLLQLLVALGIGGLAVAIASSVHRSSTRASVYQNRLLTWQQHMIVMAKSVRELCEKSDLASVPIMTSAEYAASGSLRPVLRSLNSLKIVSTREPVLQVGPDTAIGVEIKSINLVQESPRLGTFPPLAFLSLDVEIQFRAIGDSVSGGAKDSTRVFHIPILAKIDPGLNRITSCRYQEENEDKICDWMGGDVDPATSGCSGIREKL